MLFDTSISESTIAIADVEPSKYEANLEGALMCVYENECNYNALMKATGLSELKYYKETAGDLFLNEAGAFGGFLNKVKEFFKKIIEKIKALFKKFFMVINKYIMDDKDWVKKYQSQIKSVTNLKNFEVKGYKFTKKVGDGSIVTKINSIITDSSTRLESIKTSVAGEYTLEYDNEDALQDAIEEKRADMVGETGKIDESDFRDKLKKLLYGGDKEVLTDKDIDLTEQLDYISNTKSTVKAAQDAEKKVTAAIAKVISALDKKIKEFATANSNDTETQKKAKDTAIKACNQEIKIAKAQSNDATVVCGMLCQALKDRNRQAKAICIKAVSYGAKHKNESALFADDNDLFAGVTIR